MIDLMVELKWHQSLSAVISVLDSEDVIRTLSENRPEEKLDLPEESNLENEVEVNASFPQEEIHSSNSLPKTEEINVSELYSRFLQSRKHLVNFRTVFFVCLFV